MRELGLDLPLQTRIGDRSAHEWAQLGVEAVDLRRSSRSNRSSALLVVDDESKKSTDRDPFQCFPAGGQRCQSVTAQNLSQIQEAITSEENYTYGEEYLKPAAPRPLGTLSRKGLGDRHLVSILLLADSQIHIPVQRRENSLVLAPIRLHPHVEIEVDPALEVLLEVEARGGADGLDHLALTADDDLLLARTLDEDRGVDAGEIPLRVLLPAVDDHGGREGELFRGEREDLLADALGDEEPFRMHGQQLGIEQRLALRQQVPQDVEQAVAVVAFRGADRHDLREQPALGVLLDARQ